MKNVLFLFPLSLLIAVSASASSVYTESFAAGAALTSDPLVNSSAIGSFWLDNTQSNGFVTTTTNTTTITSGQFGNEIAAGPGGSGYFLFDGTNSTNTTGNNTFFASSSFAVTQNTSYTLSFLLTNAASINGNTSSVAQIGAQVNGNTLAGTVSANGFYSDGIIGDGWQTVNFTFNSGSSTSVSFNLLDLNTAGAGNNFGVTDITVSATPEPSSMALIGIGLAVTSLAARRRRLNN